MSALRQRTRFLSRELVPATRHDVLSARCSHEFAGEEARPLTESRRSEIVAANETLAGEALRTLGVAFRSLPKEAAGPEAFDERVEQDLVFLGLIGMIDPPAAKKRRMRSRARKAPAFVHHDYGRPPERPLRSSPPSSASADHRAVTGVEIGKLSEEALEQTVREVRSTPASTPSTSCDRQSHSASGMTVAMTRDGVKRCSRAQDRRHGDRHGGHRN